MKLNKFIKFPLVLGIVGTICAAALGVVYEVTNPIIQDRINQEANGAILDLIPEMDSANDLTEELSAEYKEKYRVSSAKEVIVDNKLHSYAYQVTGSGRNGDIVMMVIISATEDKVLKVKVISQNETADYFNKLVEKDVFNTYFAGISFDALGSNKADAQAGATLSFSGILGGVENAVSFHKFGVRGDVDDGINLTSSERQLLNLPETQTFVDKTDEFLAKLGNKADKAKDAMDLLHVVDIMEGGTVVGHAYITETEYIIFEGIKQKHKLVFMFDANWENSKLYAVSSSDTMNDPKNDNYQDAENHPHIVNHPYLDQFSNKSMAELINEFTTTDDLHVDSVVGVTVTTTQVKNNIVAIVRYHNDANK